MQAANVTEIDITIPKLPDWSDKDLADFMKNLEYGGHETKVGTALAWLSHHEILERYVISSK